jgi:hypothetical protein
LFAVGAGVANASRYPFTIKSAGRQSDQVLVIVGRHFITERPPNHAKGVIQRGIQPVAKLTPIHGEKF